MLTRSFFIFLVFVSVARAGTASVETDPEVLLRKENRDAIACLDLLRPVLQASSSDGSIDISVKRTHDGRRFRLVSSLRSWKSILIHEWESGAKPTLLAISPDGRIAAVIVSYKSRAPKPHALGYQILGREEVFVYDLEALARGEGLEHTNFMHWSVANTDRVADKTSRSTVVSLSIIQHRKNYHLRYGTVTTYDHLPIQDRLPEGRIQHEERISFEGG